MNYTQEQLELWQRVVDSFKDTLVPPLHSAIFKPLDLYAVTNEEVIITCKDQYALTMVIHRHTTEIQAMVQNIFGRPLALRVIDINDVPKMEEKIGHTSLNPKYTFENFIIGDSNNLAYMASLAVADAPGEMYNPLFIYGDVGLGKTHLMNAIGNYIKARNPMSNVVITTSERFTNDLIETFIKKSGTAELRNRLRNVDVLMVDDIQFLSKTEATQEEFFHTFNDLRDKGKQIVISSDRPPKDLPALADRLRSRLESGLPVDIRKPNFETRVAILRKKAESEYMDISYDIVEYIAEHFTDSIRELEGALNRVYAQARLLDIPLTLEIAIQSLEPLIKKPSSRKVTPELIMEVVCRRYDVEVSDMLSKKRNREIAVPRQIAMYICRELTDLSTTNIGKDFGGRDHTTVMHSCDKVAEQMKEDFSFRKKMEELMELVKNS